MNPSRDSVIHSLIHPGVIAVVRAPHPDPLPHLIEALLAGGVQAIEITMTTPNALKAIAHTSRSFGNQATIGVGTVLNPNTARDAIAAGARFVVTPILRPDIVPIAHAADCPVMLGPYTPTESQAAHEAGADFVKLFPADSLGPSYIKSLKAPLPHLRLVPTGGVEPGNTEAFIRAGCAAVGAGSSLIPTRAWKEHDWTSVTQLATAFVNAVRNARNPAQS